MSARTLAAVVFDLDGLMLDTEPVNRRAWQLTIAEMGFCLSDDEFEPLIGRPDEDCYRILYARFGPSFEIAGFKARWPAVWDELVAADGIATKPGLTELLRYLERLALPYAIATSSTEANARRSLTHAGLADRFEILVGGDQVQNGKPAPDIYLEAAKRLGQAPARCLALEDSEAGLNAATGARMPTIL